MHKFLYCIIVKFLLQYLQGETVENMEKTLTCVLNTGMCVYLCDSASSSVTLTLVYDPYFLYRRRCDSETLGLLYNNYIAKNVNIKICVLNLLILKFL